MLNVSIDKSVHSNKLRQLRDTGKVTLHDVCDWERRWPPISADVFEDGKFARVLAVVGRDNIDSACDVYVAYLNGSDYFVTEAQEQFIFGGRREQLEEILKLKVSRPQEVVIELMG